MSSNNANVYLKKARYGKDLVRLMRVYKEGNVQHCTELTVSCDKALFLFLYMGFNFC